MKVHGVAAAASMLAPATAGCANAVPTSTGVAACTTGAWTAAKPDPGDADNSVPPLQFESTHFAFRYDAGTTTAAAARAAATHLGYV